MVVGLGFDIGIGLIDTVAVDAVDALSLPSFPSEI